MTETEGMNRHELWLWQQARTLADLGELTAQWLEGRIASQPGYAANCGPDPETADLIPFLAGLNRAGFVTESSQPGLEPTLGYDGRQWQQRAAVGGFADGRTRIAIEEAVAGTDLMVITHLTPRHRWYDRFLSYEYRSWRDGGGEGAVVVSASTEGHEHTWFGGLMDYADVKCCYEEIGRPVFAAICDAWQVTVIDPEWGRNDLLWPTLAERFVGQRAGAA